MLKQKTLKRQFLPLWQGLHTGLNLTVTFNPAPDKPWIQDSTHRYGRTTHHRRRCRKT